MRVGRRSRNEMALSANNRRSVSVGIMVLDPAIAGSSTLMVLFMLAMIYCCCNATDSEPDESGRTSMHTHVPEVSWVV